jgi:hypothetical protein
MDLFPPQVWGGSHLHLPFPQREGGNKSSYRNAVSF